MAAFVLRRLMQALLVMLADAVSAILRKVTA